jgi:class 3 adenylate cyclase/tetratricopeptide (TPR) repeat protein
MRCAQCQTENPATANFCAHCGARLPRVCPSCGAPVAPPGRFCANCGTPLGGGAAPAPSAPSLALEARFSSFQQTLPAAFREQLETPAEGENRIITILFADLSASVKLLASRPPEDAAPLVNQVLQAMVDAILKYEGRINRMLGDGVLAFFGVPRAHENDPERAIRAALELREAVQALGLNVTAGINTGEVYLGSVGPEQHHEFTALGTTINLASRLQGLAQPGQILVGEVTYQQTRRAFVFDRTVVEIKGLTEPVAVYTVERPLPRPDKVRGVEGLQSPLIGREEELGRLRDVLSEVRAGRGQLVTLVGEAGLGKSRLVAELKQAAAADEGLVWLEGRCLEFASGVSYWPFLDALREYLGWRLEDDEPIRAARLVAMLEELVDGGALSQARSKEMLPFLAQLLSLTSLGDQHRWVSRLSPEQLKHQTFLALVDVVGALAHRHPLVLVLEDLHWADSHSLDVISLLMDALRHSALLLICVYRPERDHRCWQLATMAARRCPERYTELSLRELTPTQGRRLIEALLRIDALSPPLKAMIVEKAQGNPFFVEEVIRSLVDAGLVYAEAGRWHARPEVATLAVPATIQGVILSRVDRLEGETRRVLQSAAVIGRLFGRRLLGYVTQQERGLEQALGELEDRELIYQERAIPEEEFSFRHVLTQETVYGGILRRRRMQFHRQVAEGIEGLYRDSVAEYYEHLAYHYQRSGIVEKAVDYLIKAGDKAHQNYANEEALDYYQQALAQLPTAAANQIDPTWEVAIHRGLGQVQHRLGQHGEAEQHLRQAIDLALARKLPAREVVRIQLQLGWLLYLNRRADAVQEVADAGLALLEREQAARPLPTERQPMEEVLLRDLRGIAFALRGDHRGWLDEVGPLVPTVEQLPYAEELRPVYFHLGNELIADKNLAEALRLAEIFEGRAMAVQDLDAAGILRLTRGFACLEQGNLGEALAHARQAEQNFAQVGDVANRGFALLMQGLALLWSGDLAAAQQLADRLAGLAAPANLTWHLGAGYVLAGLAALGTGHSEAAAEAFTQAAAATKDLAGHWPSALAYDQGRVALAQGQRATAAERFRAALAQPHGPSFHSRFRVSSVRDWPILSGLEEALDDPVAFREFCDTFRVAPPAAALESVRSHWYLTPAAAPPAAVAPRFHDDFATALAPDWTWQDPFGDCRAEAGAGLVLRAANARDLREANQSAPRLLRAAPAGDWVLQTTVSPAAADRPGIGGLLVWQDTENYLALEWGRWGTGDVGFRSCLKREDRVIGRGRVVAPSVTLRLERRGATVTALVSADGQQWLSAGTVDFAADPVQVGLFAVGDIDRSCHPGAFPEGTALRFSAADLF